ncbi:MAG TPA: FKBP-type peptidyl-prolyl cis-trans isomerase [Deltaproteobacteria bacterium]|nr:FKBP-type peptidyl-prolyl cis-trans isomerase [Deltaproteobacteria bacterium]
MRRALFAITALLTIAAAGVMVRGVSEPRVAPPEPFEVAESLTPSEVRQRRRPPAARPAPSAPRLTPEGALIEHESGLQTWDIAPGRGQPPIEGQIVVVEYTGWLDGQVIDSSYQRLDPLRFAVGSGRVLPGLDEGVRQMRRGGLRQLVIPPELAFGERGVPDKIPADATLIYEIKLLDILELRDEPPEPPEPGWLTGADGLQTADLSLGPGPTLRPDKTAVLDYTMWVEAPSLETRTRIDSSLERPAPVKAGPGALLPGWEAGMRGMRVGGHRLIRLPPALAFGDEGKPPAIPPGATLILEVYLRRLE